MNIDFKTTSASYDLDADVLTATIASVTEDREHETYTIEAAFSDRRFQITDTTEEAGDSECDYAPMILVKFMQTFKSNYYCLDSSASPADVFDEEFVFTVEV
jgi:hypothetical protein